VMKMIAFVTIYILVTNGLAFAMFCIDKGFAEAGGRRIPEKWLLGIAALGGSIGALWAMKIEHHKTQKPKFVFGIPAMLAVQIYIFVKFIDPWMYGY